ncbi:tetratricopeptide repeat protein [Actinoplanes sp. NPDC051861]|uniref:tetratricopeptide repeat protein n=1 Tax=Actinoplanes sp. NPDC051861 TaxID=3155170 RepID=UPI00343E5F1E
MPDAEVTGSSGFQIGDHNKQTNVGYAGPVPPPQRTGSGTVHNLPPASKVFVGRDLEALADRLSGESGVVVGQAAVHGLGGIGKSELVNQYARAFLSRYSLVWWITADSVEAIGLGLAALTSRLHPVATLADAQAWATGWLQANNGWLLVLDNVENVDDIAELLGVVEGHGQIVVTTRRDLGAARWARLGLEPLPLELLDRGASVDLLLRLTGLDDQDGAGRLAAELGDLPLALDQAAAYVSQHDGMDFDDYRALLTTQFERAASEVGYGGAAGRSVTAVWTVTMDAVAGQDPLAVHVMAVLAWLAPDDLPDDVLDLLTDDPADVADALALLASYSMVSRSAGMVSVHRLVQAVTRNAQDEDTVQKLQQVVVKLLLRAIPADPINNVKGWPRWASLLPHIDSLNRDLADSEVADMLYLADRAATYRQYQGQADTAIAEFEKVLAGRRRMLGDNHRQTLTARHNLAVCYVWADRLDAAIVEYEKAASGLRELLGDDHPSTLMTRHNLADTYRRAGRVDEAIVELEAVLAVFRRVRGEDHIDTLMTRGNLASAYETAGRTAEAIAGAEAVLADQRRVLGDDHPNTLTTRSNLAAALGAAGRAGEALAAHQTLLADRRRILGADHPDTLMSRNNVAIAHLALGRADEAIAEFEGALADGARALGHSHWIVSGIAKNLDVLKGSENADRPPGGSPTAG